MGPGPLALMHQPSRHVEPAEQGTFGQHASIILQRFISLTQFVKIIICLRSEMYQRPF